VKLGPIYQDVHPLARPLLRRVRLLRPARPAGDDAHGSTFSSGVPAKRARPAHMDRVAVDFPELRIVPAYVGRP
jgi:predicted TIM-barrel fold metal-dependent hydrolase